MSATIHISAKAGRYLLELVTQRGHAGSLTCALDAQRELGRALSKLDRLKVRKAPRLKAAKKKKLVDAGRMAATRQMVFARAEDRCEVFWADVRGDWHRCGEAPSDLEHAFGRRTEQDKYSPDGCLAVCRKDHRNRTNEYPSAEVWRERYRESFARIGLTASARRCEDRREFNSVKSSLPAAPKSRAAFREAQSR